MTRKWPRCVHSSLIWMKDVNVFSVIEHILSQRALPYYSYIYTTEDKSNFYLKFSICGRNYRIDDHQNFWQIINFSFELVHAISCHSHLLFSSIFFKQEKDLWRYSWGSYSESMSTGQTFSIMSTSSIRSHHRAEAKVPKQEFLWPRIWISLEGLFV